LASHKSFKTNARVLSKLGLIFTSNEYLSRQQLKSNSQELSMSMPILVILTLLHSYKMAIEVIHQELISHPKTVQVTRQK